MLGFSFFVYILQSSQHLQLKNMEWKNREAAYGNDKVISYELEWTKKLQGQQEKINKGSTRNTASGSHLKPSEMLINNFFVFFISIFHPPQYMIFNTKDTSYKKVRRRLQFEQQEISWI